MRPRILRSALALAACALLAPLALPSAAAAGPGEESAPGYLGVRLQRVEGGLAEALDLEEDAGVLLGQVIDDGPGAAAGLRAGDIVVAVDGETVGTPADLQRAVRDHAAGDEVTVAYLRDGKRRDATVTLGEAPADLRRERVGRLDRAMRKVHELKLDRERPWLGVVTQPLTGELGAYFGTETGGALVSEVVEDSPAAKLGLKPGDVIVRVGDASVEDPGDLSRAIRGLDEAGDVEIVWMRDRKERSGTAALEMREVRGRPGMFSWRSDDGDEEVLELMGPDGLERHLKMFRHHVGDDGHPAELGEDMRAMLEELRASIEDLRRDMEELKDSE